MGIPISQAKSYEERVATAAKTVSEAGITMPVLVDEMDNPLWCTYGRMPNIAFLIGADGRIVLRQDWNDAPKMEQAIDRYLARGQ